MEKDTFWLMSHYRPLIDSSIPVQFVKDLYFVDHDKSVSLIALNRHMSLCYPSTKTTSKQKDGYHDYWYHNLEEVPVTKQCSLVDICDYLKKSTNNFAKIECDNDTLYLILMKGQREVKVTYPDVAVTINNDIVDLSIYGFPKRMELTSNAVDTVIRFVNNAYLCMGVKCNLSEVNIPNRTKTFTLRQVLDHKGYKHTYVQHARCHMLSLYKSCCVCRASYQRQKMSLVKIQEATLSMTMKTLESHIKSKNIPVHALTPNHFVLKFIKEETDVYVTFPNITVTAVDKPAIDLTNFGIPLVVDCCIEEVDSLIKCINTTRFCKGVEFRDFNDVGWQNSRALLENFTIQPVIGDDNQISHVLKHVNCTGLVLNGTCRNCEQGLMHMKKNKPTKISDVIKTPGNIKHLIYWLMKHFEYCPLSGRTLPKTRLHALVTDHFEGESLLSQVDELMFLCFPRVQLTQLKNGNSIDDYYIDLATREQSTPISCRKLAEYLKTKHQLDVHIATDNCIIFRVSRNKHDFQVTLPVLIINIDGEEIPVSDYGFPDKLDFSESNVNAVLHFIECINICSGVQLYNKAAALKAMEQATGRTLMAVFDCNGEIKYSIRHESCEFFTLAVTCVTCRDYKWPEVALKTDEAIQSLKSADDFNFIVLDGVRKDGKRTGVYTLIQGTGNMFKMCRDRECKKFTEGIVWNCRTSETAKCTKKTAKCRAQILQSKNKFTLIEPHSGHGNKPKYYSMMAKEHDKSIKYKGQLLIPDDQIEGQLKSRQPKKANRKSTSFNRESGITRCQTISDGILECATCRCPFLIAKGGFFKRVRIHDVATMPTIRWVFGDRQYNHEYMCHPCFDFLKSKLQEKTKNSAKDLGHAAKAEESMQKKTELDNSTYEFSTPLDFHSYCKLSDFQHGDSCKQTASSERRDNNAASLITDKHSCLSPSTSVSYDKKVGGDNCEFTAPVKTIGFCDKEYQNYVNEFLGDLCNPRDRSSDIVGVVGCESSRITDELNSDVSGLNSFSNEGECVNTVFSQSNDTGTSDMTKPPLNTLNNCNNDITDCPLSITSQEFPDMIMECYEVDTNSCQDLNPEHSDTNVIPDNDDTHNLLLSSHSLSEVNLDLTENQSYDHEKVTGPDEVIASEADDNIDESSPQNMEVDGPNQEFATMKEVVATSDVKVAYHNEVVALDEGEVTATHAHKSGLSIQSVESCSFVDTNVKGTTPCLINVNGVSPSLRNETSASSSADVITNTHGSSEVYPIIENLLTAGSDIKPSTTEGGQSDPCLATISDILSTVTYPKSAHPSYCVVKTPGVKAKVVLHTRPDSNTNNDKNNLLTAGSDIKPSITEGSQSDPCLATISDILSTATYPKNAHPSHCVVKTPGVKAKVVLHTRPDSNTNNDKNKYFNIDKDSTLSNENTVHRNGGKYTTNCVLLPDKQHITPVHQNKEQIGDANKVTLVHSVPSGKQICIPPGSYTVTSVHKYNKQIGVANTGISVLKCQKNEPISVANITNLDQYKHLATEYKQILTRLRHIVDGFIKTGYDFKCESEMRQRGTRILGSFNQFQQEINRVSGLDNEQDILTLLNLKERVDNFDKEVATFINNIHNLDTQVEDLECQILIFYQQIEICDKNFDVFSNLSNELKRNTGVFTRELLNARLPLDLLITETESLRCVNVDIHTRLGNFGRAMGTVYNQLYIPMPNTSVLLRNLKEDIKQLDAASSVLNNASTKRDDLLSPYTATLGTT